MGKQTFDDNRLAVGKLYPLPASKLKNACTGEEEGKGTYIPYDTITLGRQYNTHPRMIFRAAFLEVNPRGCAILPPV